LIEHGVAQEPGRDQIVLSGVRQLVAGDLFDDKTVVGQVTVERIDDPIAIRPNEARLVLFKTVRVGVTRGVQPVPPPTLAIMGRVDRKSTRLNSSHVAISYAVFCLKKKMTA